VTAPAATAEAPPGEQKIVILGAGPTGLAAAYRLAELGHRNYRIFEARHKVGGLASSEVSPNGFTYDIGGHVLFSHYEYFDRLFDKLMGDEYKELVREAWVWMCGRFLPYPLQNNIKDLPKEVVLECLLGLVEAQKTPLNLDEIENFEQLIMKQFGAGLAKYFMMPYNFKVWAHPPRMMNKEWIGERVALPKLERVLGNVIMDRDDAGWGPNNTFKYPLYGGTGGLFERIVPYIKDHLVLNSPAASVDAEAKTVTFADGRVESYDVLMTTLPMDKFAHLTRGLPTGSSTRPSGCATRGRSSSAWASTARPRRRSAGCTSPRPTRRSTASPTSRTTRPRWCPTTRGSTRCSPRSRTRSSSPRTATRSSTRRSRGWSTRASSPRTTCATAWSTRS
jgi:protoporphyrinogen oxidase